MFKHKKLVVQKKYFNENKFDTMHIIHKFLFLLSLFLNLSIYSQTLSVEYEKFNHIKSNNFNLSTQLNDKINESRKIPQKHVLYYKDGLSYFKSIPRSTLTHNAGDTREDANTTLHKREVFKDTELKIFHHNNEKGNYIYHNFQDLNEEFYGYKDTQFIKIEYKDDVMNIDNYVCNLVEVSFNPSTTYKVWYTEAIPISAGPYSFNNFPGLVLRVESNNYVITAVKINNDIKSSEFEEINPKLKVYKNEDYDNKLKSVNEQLSKPTFEEIKL